MNFSRVNWGANSVAHSSSRYAKNVIEDVYWMEDPPPQALDALYYDSLHLNE